MKTIKIFSTDYVRRVYNLFNYNNTIEGYDVIFDNDIRDCDVMVVLAEGDWNKYRFKTNADKRILITLEPASIYRYSSDFFNQFTDVITSQYDILVSENTKVHRYHQSNNFLIGWDENTINIDELCKTFNNRNKTKLISAIASNKCMTEYHYKRREFILKLKNDIPELDIYGTMTGSRLRLKDYALREYKYSIAIENCSVENYWTEKIGDCIYSLTDPIYCGCTNIDDYFDDILKIDINDYEKSLENIRNRIYGEYDIEKMIGRRIKLLKEHSLFKTIEKTLKGEI